MQIKMDKNTQRIVESAKGVGQRFVFNVASRFASMRSGEKYGAGMGSSLEFLDHREYQPGDDIRHIDWNALARSDKLTVKLFREEISPHLDILIDGSASMNLDDTAKYAALMSGVAVMRAAALNSGYNVSAWIIKDRCEKIPETNFDVERWRGTDCVYAGNTGKTLVTMPPPLKPRGVRILFSDLFWETEPETILRQLTNNAALVIIIQVVAKIDEEPDLLGNLRLVDSESGETLEVMADKPIIKEYIKNFNRHRNYWRDSCTKSGAFFTHLVAEDFIKDFVPQELLKTEILVAGGK